MSSARHLGAALVAGMLAATAAAVPLVPTHDGQVIERLAGPAPLRTGPAGDAVQAVSQAKALMQAARREGDPRLAGRALALLKPWTASPEPRADVVVAMADAEQHLHQFDAATARLQALVAHQPAQPQAWLMLATLHRVQGRFDASDQACRQLQRQRIWPHGEACLAENQGLRGQVALAARTLTGLRERAPDAATRAWLGTTLAELATRSGPPAAAETAWRAVLADAPDDAYALVAFADSLLDASSPAAAWALLRGRDGGEALLMRQLRAAREAGAPEAAPLAARLRERQAQAALRGEPAGHERERAWQALHLERNPAAALPAALANVARQREPVDLLLLARCAAAARDGAALVRARELSQQMGLHDARLQALL